MDGLRLPPLIEEVLEPSGQSVFKGCYTECEGADTHVTRSCDHHSDLKPIGFKSLSDQQQSVHFIDRMI